VVGLVPALHAANPDLLPALRDEGGGVAGSPRGRRLRRAFVVAQVALSMVLLVGASLLLRGLARAASLAPGFEVEQTRLVPVDLGLAGYDVAQTTALIEALAERAPRLPGARAAALTLTLPVELHVARRSTLAEGYVPRPGEEREIWFGVVGPGHFEALGIPILRGRAFTPADGAAAPAVAIVNESFAARFWPGRDPIGLTLRMRGEDGPPVEVVGLAKDSKYRSLTEEPMPFYYLPIAQDFAFVERFARLFPLHVVVRGGGDFAATGRAVAAALREIDPDLPVYPARPMAEHLGISALPSRVASLVFTAFGALGLFLASLGLYGVVAYAMARRTREIGVRMALGASRRDVLELGIRDGLTLALAGVGLGALLAAALGQGLRSLLFGLSPVDPVSFLLVPLLLAVVALAASAIPAARAARVDPVEALRHE
jgi:predicted permease